jgi:enoyl-CoA hydratase/carnithine racemase
MTARSIDAETAVEWGVLLEVVPDSQLSVRTMELAQDIASKPRPAVVLAKRLLRQAKNMDLDAFLEYSAALQAVAHTTPEHEAAVATYLENLKSRD